ncbi:MAG: MFS transporter, partial [Pseudomonadota bacterium]
MRWLPEGTSRDAGLLLWVKALRAFGDGYMSILLPVYLLRLGYDPFQVGVLTSTALVGAAALTLAVGLLGHRFARRVLLMAATGLMIATGLALPSVRDFWPLLLVGFFGTVNLSSGDVGVFLPLEQALLAQTVADRNRTAIFARYSLTGALVGALGALGAGLPDYLAALIAFEDVVVMRAMLFAYAFLGLAAFFIYRRLSIPNERAAGRPQKLGASRAVVFKLTALFSLDAFGGGFFVQSLLALWLLDRFDLSLAATSRIFFWSGVLTAASFLAAVPIARRFGLVNTMVFTHLPANVCMVLIPFMPSLWPAIVLLLVRAFLSQMDVPTRTSYVMAVVTPAERPAAASLTSVPRSLASASSPVLAGWLMSLSVFGWPLVAGGIIKIVYDLLLLAAFRNLRPPEEVAKADAD